MCLAWLQGRSALDITKNNVDLIIFVEVAPLDRAEVAVRYLTLPTRPGEADPDYRARRLYVIRHGNR